MPTQIETATPRFQTEAPNNFQAYFTKGVIELSLLPTTVGNRIFDTIGATRFRRTVGSKLDDFLRHLGMAEQIDQQLGFGEPSVGRENSSVELTGALIGGSLTAGSLYEFMRLTAYAISQDNSPIEKLAHGFMGMLLAESSFTTIAAIGVFAGRELAAPFANHQTREGIKHFLEIEHVIPENNQPF